MRSSASRVVFAFVVAAGGFVGAERLALAAPSGLCCSSSAGACSGCKQIPIIKNQATFVDLGSNPVSVCVAPVLGPDGQVCTSALLVCKQWAAGVVVPIYNDPECTNVVGAANGNVKYSTPQCDPTMPSTACEYGPPAP